ncbi:MAG: ATP-binding protein [Deltaproteobacteria bacterium]|nr:ATP-binding protein [Deltaproteobacteria bacterium]
MPPVLSSPPEASDAFESLVSQFSSATDCFRELVQNSIDAGSLTIEVWLEFVPGDGPLGTIAVHVDDYGEGMDERVVHEELTRLFASSKDRDLTKIGKFGIGFVSVFALRPKAVLIHTGREGCYLEVLIEEDRSYSCERIDTPVEGTRVTVFIAGDRQDHVDLCARAREALARWCCHSDVEITFEDRSDPESCGPEKIAEPFQLSGLCPVEHSEPGTQIVMAYDRPPSYGFYNRGLALLVTGDVEEALPEHVSAFRHVSFKIKSRYLEHTLSRETVFRDASFDKAVQKLIELRRGPLRRALVENLTALAASGEQEPASEDRYMRLLEILAEEDSDFLVAEGKQPVLRTWNGQATTLEQAFRSLLVHGRVFVSTRRSVLVDRLCERRMLVFRGDGRRSERDEPMRTLLSRSLLAQESRSLLGMLGKWTGLDLRADVLKAGSWFAYDLWARSGQRVVDPHRVFRALEIDPQPLVELRALVDGAACALEEIGAPYKRVSTCRLADPEIAPPLFLIGPELDPLMARPPDSLEPDAQRSSAVAINRDHPRLAMFQRIHARWPALAVYALAKDLLLATDQLLDRDQALMDAARRICEKKG